ncbi:protein RETICULATA-RELATED 4, chloroplastic-like protein [Cinnamomum micranthum f. kanehirae]|uniref:Protein RETICULATA-RELATED 4, chloroplastic-like protein n=1 Tax=Cinnamomum micranthum f. kanehirae TaxID=337451 RepID=A0A3S3R1A4_9MAGN|nr:protein RETICULATA-RELATED 4, chloroplastic-like protein [Cinnamomum micranthum f. kanehirae]
MALAATSHFFSTRHLEFLSLNHSRPSHHHLPSIILHSHCPASPISPRSCSLNHRHKSPLVVRSVGNSGGGGRFGSGSGGGGDDDDEEEEEEGRDRNLNRVAALRALVEVGRNLDSIPADLAMAIQNGRVPGLIVHRFVELERSPFLRWLMQFGGFTERLLADDLFLTKVAIECGVGVFTKTAAEWERRRENFFKELDFVFADVVMAIIADFMLVWLPAPTVSLRPPIAIGAGRISKFFYSCPDNAFQVALSGTSYSFLQRIGAIMRNGAKLFAVGTSASLVPNTSGCGGTENFGTITAPTQAYAECNVLCC